MLDAQQASELTLNARNVHACLTMLRFDGFVIFIVNTLWNRVVDIDENSALASVRQTYVRPLKITIISGFVALVSAFAGERVVQKGGFDRVTGRTNT